MSKQLQIRNSTAEFLIFQAEDKAEGVQVFYQDESIWATQEAIATLFDKGRSTITEHLRNIYQSGELNLDTTCRKFRHMGSTGQEYETKYYNLDAIISVGYRVNSRRATQFRQWCTAVLRQFAIRGYVIDKKRMENGAFIYATAIDYNRDAPTTREFFAKVQNKMHYAVHGQTAAELIVSRANAEKEHMGLTTWENAPHGKIVKPDVSIAKNYLNEAELEDMGRLVNSVLDAAERMAKRHIPMTMEDWAKRIDIILEATDDRILTDAGSVSHEFAQAFAETEFEKYRIIQDRIFESDFDRFELPSLPFEGDTNGE